MRLIVVPPFLKTTQSPPIRTTDRDLVQAVFDEFEEAARTFASGITRRLSGEIGIIDLAGHFGIRGEVKTLARRLEKPQIFIQFF